MSSNQKAKRATWIALLRGINVAGANKIRMADLRRACEDLGWEAVRTYIQSGNIVFRAAGKAAELEKALEEAIAREFDLSIPAIVRAAAEWPDLLAGNPFPEAAETEPRLVHLVLSKSPPNKDAAEALQARAADGERVRQSGAVLWVHYPGGSGRSKLSPALFDRLVGSTITARNWRTALKIAEMAAGE